MIQEIAVKQATGSIVLPQPNDRSGLPGFLCSDRKTSAAATMAGRDDDQASSA